MDKLQSGQNLFYYRHPFFQYGSRKWTKMVEKHVKCVYLGS
jgi:hypothetical protein